MATKRSPAERAGRLLEYRFTQSGREFRLQTQPGVFSAGSPDEGSLLLLDTVVPNVKAHQRVLDLGAGSGIIGIAIAPLVPRGEVWMVDVDIRATRLVQRNMELNGITNAHVVLGDVTLDLPKRLRFDCIVSNPPTHGGREVLEQFVREAYSVLRPGGSLWLVVNRLLSVKSMMDATFGNVELVARKKGFLILRSTRERTH